MNPETATPGDDSSETPLRAELERYGDELAPGALETLVGLWARRLEKMTDDQVAERVAEWIEEPEIAVWAKNFKRPQANQARCPLRVVLDRRARELRPGAAQALFRAWRFELTSTSIPTLAGEIARRLAAPEYASFLRRSGEGRDGEEVVHAVVARYAAELLPGAVEELGRRWTTELGRFSARHQIVEGVVFRLSQPAFAGFFKPGRSMPKTGQDALGDALARRRDLRPHALSELLGLWSPLMAHLPPARVAGLVELRLASPSGASYLIDP